MRRSKSRTSSSLKALSSDSMAMRCARAERRDRRRADALRRRIGVQRVPGARLRARAAPASADRIRRPAPPDRRARDSGSCSAPAARAARRRAPPAGLPRPARLPAHMRQLDRAATPGSAPRPRAAAAARCGDSGTPFGPAPCPCSACAKPRAVVSSSSTVSSGSAGPGQHGEQRHAAKFLLRHLRPHRRCPARSGSRRRTCCGRRRACGETPGSAR